MTGRFLRFAALVAALDLMVPAYCLAQQPAHKMDLSGVYRCEGVNPNGTPYRGRVEITKDDHTYRLRWTMAQGASLGIGIVNGDVLAVSYFTGANVGIVLYKIQKGSQLIGEWALLGADGQLYPEELTKIGIAAERQEPDELLADVVAN